MGDEKITFACHFANYLAELFPLRPPECGNRRATARAFVHHRPCLDAYNLSHVFLMRQLAGLSGTPLLLWPATRWFITFERSITAS